MPHTGTVLLETPRLYLRRFTTNDAEAMFANWANDAEVTRWLRWEPHANPDESRAILQDWVKGYANPEHYLWAMERKEGNALMGSIGLFYNTDPAEGPNGWEPAYCIGRAFWGKGYTTEALQAILAHFMQNTGITALHCCHATGNPASGRVMQKAGFVYSHPGEYHRFNGSAVPALFYELHAHA